MKQEFYKALIDSPLGPMLVVADEKFLYLLEFVDGRNLKPKIEQLCFKTKSAIIPGTTAPLEMAKNELTLYFKGQLKIFETPLFLSGSPFQKMAWEMLKTIPYGETRSYSEQARIIGRPLACRAVANANGANKISIIVPCHRIIKNDGKIGGYGGGVMRKKWLLEHERKIQNG